MVEDDADDRCVHALQISLYLPVHSPLTDSRNNNLQESEIPIPSDLLLYHSFPSHTITRFSMDSALQSLLWVHIPPGDHFSVHDKEYPQAIITGLPPPSYMPLSSFHNRMPNREYLMQSLISYQLPLSF